jgi:hypothetical protein
VFRLEMFNMRRHYEIAVGDFHTLVIAAGCNCTDSVNDACKGRESCNGGSDLYCWGFNIHGQCNGMPSKSPVLTPQIVPFFHSNNIKIDKIAARRSRSVAVSTENKVYEWGFVGSDGEQFNNKLTLPAPCLQVEIGLEFDLYLLADGTLHMAGLITQEGNSVISASTGVLDLSSQMSEQVSFKQI